jgi:hypothetical protein
MSLTWQAFQRAYSQSGATREQVSRAWSAYKAATRQTAEAEPASMFDREPTPRVDVSYALQTLEQVRKIGYAGLRAFTLVRVPSTDLEPDEDETEEQAVEKHSTICFNGARYLRMWLGEEQLTTRRDDITLRGVRELSTSDLTLLEDGVYYLDLEGREGHHFVWVIAADTLVYGGSYGGICALSVVKHSRLDYLRRFKLALSGSLEEYAHVFDVDPVVSEVAFRVLVIQRSRRYV